ncbi:MAG: GNAT family N-acetyltransferase [Acidobacteria bacterium]|nr:GNAT family N-acetyltransferase [Acidobacteriota bacterium]
MTASIETDRLLLRRPAASDVAAMFERYASDPDATRYLGWPRHRSLEDTRAFLAFSDAEWARWPAGPYVIVDRGTSRLLGGTGLAFERADRAMTGYVLAKDAWGRGYATEALRAMVGLARDLGVTRLYALCHTAHRPSWHVLEKCGFAREAARPGAHEFPNLASGDPQDVFCYARAL